MVAIVSGNGLGLFNSSLGLLGAAGADGNAGLGRSGEGVYLNAATGNLVLQRQDDLLVGPGQDINLVRTYNSQGLLNDDNGDNWRLGVHERLGNLVGTIGAAGSSIHRTGGDGVDLTYTYDATLGRYVNKDGAGSFDYLDYNSATSTWTWLDGNSRVSEKYDWIGGAGKLLSVSELGSSTSISYGYTGNNLTMITGEDGEKVTFDYAGNNLTAIHTIDASGVATTRVRYTYDASNRLNSVVVDLTPGDNSVADGKTYVTTYTYDGASTRVAGITQSDGSRVNFIYKTQTDGSVRVAQITQSLAGATRSTNIVYDLAGRSTSVTDPLGSVTVYGYDAQGRLLNLKGPAVGDGLANPGVTYTYDADGNMASQTDARGLTTTYQYDASGNLTLQRDAAGNTVTRTYGAANELLTETRYLTPDPDGAGAGLPGAPLTTRYVYDSLARLRFVVSPEGRVSEYRYGAGSSRLVGASVAYTGTAYTTATGGSTPAQLYDALAAWAAGSAVDKTRSTLTSVVRDSRGQVSSSTVYAKVDANGAGVADGSESTTRYIYDQAGQLLQSIAPKGVATTGVADDFVTNYSYDGLGRLLSATDALKNATLYQYDDAGNTTRTTSANGLVTTSAYNRAGELVTVTQSSGTVLGATSYQYDADGRLRMTQDPLGLRHFYFYDAAGRKVAEVDANGSLTEYRYNQDNQLVQTVAHATALTAAALASLVDAGGNVTQVALATIVPAANALDIVGWNFYDNAGRLAKTRDGLAYVTEFKYDGAGQLVAQLRYANAATGAVSLATLATDAAATPTVNAAADRITRNFYDNDGLLLGTLDGAGYLSENEYDAGGRLVHTIAYATLTSATYFASGTLAQLRPVANANDIHNWTLYDGQGRVIAQVDGEGYLTETAYDANGNVAQRTRYATKALLAPTALTAATTLASLRPAVSSADQKVLWTYTDLNQVKSQTDAQGTVTQYVYNSVGQVIRTDKAANTTDLRTLQVRYDAQGRVLAELSGEGSAALALLSAPTAAQVDALWAQYGTSYLYDADGRRLSSTDANGYMTRLYYDADGNLKYTVNAMGEVRQSSYNALNQVTQTTVYAQRIDATTLAAMKGGDAATVDAGIAAIASSALDGITSFDYDARGALIRRSAGQTRVSTLTLNAFGETAAQVDKIDATTSVRTLYGYDKRGLLSRTTEDADGLARITSQVKDAFGRTTQTIYANGSTDGASYDRLGRAVVVLNPLHVAHTSTYDAFGRMLTDRDSAGRVTTYVYDTVARSMTITTPEGVSSTTTRNRDGDIVQVKDGNGYTTTYVYDRDGNLRGSTNDALGATETKAYDHADRLIETTDANGVKTGYGYDAANRVLTRTVDPTGLKLVTTYAYDAKGQTVSVTDPNLVVTQTVYDNLGQVASVTVDPAGLALRTQYAYDGRGKVLTVTEGAGSATPRLTQYTFDKLGRRIQQMVDPSGLKLTTTYTYDSNDNVVSRTEGAGTAQAATTRYTYDAANRLLYTIDALGGVALNSYSTDGQLLQTTVYATALTAANVASISVGALAASATIAGLVVADATRDRVTRHAYDNDGRERFTIDALGAVTERQYDKAGNLLKLVQYANTLGGTLAAGALPLVLTAASGTAGYVVGSGADRVSTYVYDAANRLTSQTRGAGSAAATTEGWAYDKAGNTLSHTDGRNNTTWFAYDTANRLARQVDAGGYLTTRSYYPDGTLASVTRFKNAVGVPTVADNLWASHAPAVVANTDAVQGDQVTSYTYDKAYRVSTMRDAGGNLTRYVYDALGNTTDTTLADGTAAAATTHRTYDLAGRVATETRAFGTAVASTTRYAYDALDNQTDIFVAEGTTAAAHTIQTFDLVGRKTKVIAADGGATTTNYNAFGDIVTVTDALNNIGYFYGDALGRVTLQVDPAGAATETRYDMLGNTVETIRYSNRVQGALSAAVRPQVLAAAGSGVYVVTSAGVDQRQVALVDTLGRVSEIRTWWGAADTEYYSEKFTYDQAGNVLAAQARNNAVTTYQYDKLNHKISEMLPVKSKNSANTMVAVENHYAYDALGNLTTKTEAYGLLEQRVTQYAFDKLNRQVSETGQSILTFDQTTQTDKPVAPIKQRVYDARGNLIEEVDVLGGRTLHYYNLADREVGRIDAAGAYTAYIYDAAGNKKSQTAYATAVAVVGGGAIGTGAAPAVLSVAPAAGSYVLSDDLHDRKTSYTYDAAGRLATTQIDAMLLGSLDSAALGGAGQFKDAGSKIVTTNEYDLLGNLVRSYDANGNVTRRYYNGAGQLVGQLDALRYLTVWQRDAYGNVLQETQYASAVSAALVLGNDTTLAQLMSAANLVLSSDDRVTNYTYDRMNRTTRQARANVSYVFVSSDGGLALPSGTTESATSYMYDGLSNVVRRTDSGNVVTDTTYDEIGRKTREQSPGYVDYLGHMVRPTTDYEYDGLSNLSRQIARGTDQSGEADDRITVYRYGAGGYLTGQTDATQAQLEYRLDAAGHIVKKTQVNLRDADNAAVIGVTNYWYDKLGREIKHADLATGTTEEVRYDAFGDITGKRTNGAASGDQWAQYADYDRAGRVWRSNFDNGISKAYLYDANGNQTLMLDADIDLRGLSQVSIMSLATTNQTFSVYDARNHLLDTYEPVMVGGHHLIDIEQSLLARAGVIGAGGGGLGVGAGVETPVAGATVGAGEINATSAQTITGTLYSSYTDYQIVAGGRPITLYQPVHKLTVTVPNMSAWGTGEISISVSLGTYPGTQFSGYSNTFPIPAGTNPIVVNFMESKFDASFPNIAGQRQFSFTISVVNTVTNTPTPVGTISGMTQNPTASGQNISAPASQTLGDNMIQFAGQNSAATKLVMMMRRTDNPVGWSYSAIDSSYPTLFKFNWAGMAPGVYEIHYATLDANGTVFNSAKSFLTVGNGTASVTKQEALPIGGLGQAFFDNANRLHITEQGAAVKSISIRYRASGSTNVWSTRVVLSSEVINNSDTPGWFVFDPAGLTGKIDYVVETRGNTGQIINTVKGDFIVNDPTNVSALVKYNEAPVIASFSQPLTANTMALYYREVGTTDYVKVTLTLPVNGVFNWNTASVFQSDSVSKRYEYKYETFDTHTVMVNKGHGSVTLGATAALEHTLDPTPTLVSFTLPDATIADSATQLICKR